MNPIYRGRLRFASHLRRAAPRTDDGYETGTRTTGRIGLGVARNRRRLGAVVWIGRRHRRQWRPYRDAPGRSRKPSTGPRSTTSPRLHHQHAIADIAHHVEIVADQEISQAELALRSASRLSTWASTPISVVTRDTASSRSRGRGDNASAPRDIDALTLAARKSVRIANWQTSAASPPCPVSRAPASGRRCPPCRGPWGPKRDKLLDGRRRDFREA